MFDKYQFVKKSNIFSTVWLHETQVNHFTLLDFVLDAYRSNDNKEIMYTLYLDFAEAFNSFFSFYQISWIFINKVPCVSSCWGEKTHTRGLQRK